MYAKKYSDIRSNNIFNEVSIKNNQTIEINSKKIKNKYLIEKFKIGEETGRKVCHEDCEN